jgi:hypothetical protein
MMGLMNFGEEKPGFELNAATGRRGLPLAKMPG